MVRDRVIINRIVKVSIIRALVERAATRLAAALIIVTIHDVFDNAEVIEVRRYW